jgi:hypothetical protein
MYFAKRHGFMTGLFFRIKAMLKALVTLQLPLFAALVSWSKIDGSQSAIL